MYHLIRVYFPRRHDPFHRNPFVSEPASSSQQSLRRHDGPGDYIVRVLRNRTAAGHGAVVHRGRRHPHHDDDDVAVVTSRFAMATVAAMDRIVPHILMVFRLCRRYSCRSRRQCRCRPATSAGPAVSAVVRWAAVAWRWANHTSASSVLNHSVPTISWCSTYACTLAKNRTSVPTASAASNSSATYNSTPDYTQVFIFWKYLYIFLLTIRSNNYSGILFAQTVNKQTEKYI